MLQLLIGGAILFILATLSLPLILRANKSNDAAPEPAAAPVKVTPRPSSTSDAGGLNFEEPTDDAAAAAKEAPVEPAQPEVAEEVAEEVQEAAPQEAKPAQKTREEIEAINNGPARSSFDTGEDTVDEVYE